jgi:hypothetical protein
VNVLSTELNAADSRINEAECSSTISLSILAFLRLVGVVGLHNWSPYRDCGPSRADATAASAISPTDDGMVELRVPTEDAAYRDSERDDSQRGQHPNGEYSARPSLATVCELTVLSSSAEEPPQQSTSTLPSASTPSTNASSAVPSSSFYTSSNPQPSSKGKQAVPSSQRSIYPTSSSVSGHPRPSYSDTVSKGAKTTTTDQVTSIIIEDDDDQRSSAATISRPESTSIRPLLHDSDNGAPDIRTDGWVADGCPDPADIPKIGRGALVSYMLGSSSPGFSLGKAWGWHATAWDYELVKFDPARDAQLRQERRKSSLPPPSVPPSSDGTDPQRQEASKPSYIPPTFDELLSARPHEHAFFCRKTFEWRVVTPWKLTEGDPVASEGPVKPLVRHFVNLGPRVDPRFVLSPGYDGRLGSPGARPSRTASSEPSLSDPTPSKTWWELHSCDSSSLSIVVSPPGAIPGVLDSKLVEELENERRQNPAAGSSPIDSVLGAWEYIWK